MEKKVYSLQTFKWRKAGVFVIAISFFVFGFMWALEKMTSIPQWHTASVEEVLEAKGLETVAVEIEPGDSFWKVQRRVEPNAEMWKMHEAFMYLNPTYDGHTIMAGHVYLFPKNKEAIEKKNKELVMKK